MTYFTKNLEGNLTLVRCACGNHVTYNSLLSRNTVVCINCKRHLLNSKTQQILADDYKLLSKEQYQTFLKINKIV